MIRINLLPQQKRAKASQAGKELAFLVFLFCVLLGGIGGTQYWMHREIQTLEEHIATKTTRKNELFEQIRHLRQQEKELASLEERIQAIKIIREAQGLPVRYLDALVSLLPEDEIWFESLQFSRSRGISLRGVALDNQAFAQYVQQLRESPYIQSIQTRRTSRRRVQNLDLVEFQTEISTGEPEDKGEEGRG
ncbi:PilN domain-containing protein [Desulfohalobium retbaense]|uniref:Fimbrial assembly family protein n=1 Tax=Desulfohalobium retbaense (strain ATCC 49708 / DSM 5692 / JCM 16813 / HR100) TaxID=485915 RepID=C8X4Y9_DESRD|nr:PilN domain-containing protein [Desulfohalobium retbaense]ACV69486.1 Fimbrial assembly family protein [Desulfohalobium retbaense DSM 5692]